MATNTTQTNATTKRAANIAHINEQIEQAAHAYKRDPSLIKLLAVSKTKPVPDIICAYESGQRHFGENYVQEAVEKIQQMTDYSDILWHFIGPLQSNKSKFIAEYFDWMHSLERIKIAKRLNEQRSVYQSPLNVCVQVNIDNEVNKAGIAAHEVLDFIEQLQALPRLKCRGLMTIPKAGASDTERKDSFTKMQALFAQCAETFDNIDTLSMGMSGDLEIAVEYGSTMVRIGTAIFGKRA
jgi:pyridoxal phosphate enzyme (YggS family)